MAARSISVRDGSATSEHVQVSISQTVKRSLTELYQVAAGAMVATVSVYHNGALQRSMQITLMPPTPPPTLQISVSDHVTVSDNWLVGKPPVIIG